MFHNSEYQLGCPVWACPAWRGSVFEPRAPRSAWLGQYSRVFGTVEGNSTFYGVPAEETFQQWADRSAAGFQFCLKFPRAVSHDAPLTMDREILRPFFRGLEILAREDRLGPTFLQLGPHFDGSGWARLDQFLARLPQEFAYAVELRHADWFEPEAQARLDERLAAQRIDRVIFDSRALFALPATDEIEVAARARKPRVPVRMEVTGRRPMVRLIGRNQVDSAPVQVALDTWADQVSAWMDQGLRPIVFTHTPDDARAPEMARQFHNRLARRRPRLSPIDGWPQTGPQQKMLF